MQRQKTIDQGADAWVDDKSVARITGRAVQTLRNDRFNGRGLPYTKFGRLCRYRLSEVYDFLEKNRIVPDPL